jgi:hypothetical protein
LGHLSQPWGSESQFVPGVPLWVHGVPPSDMGHDMLGQAAPLVLQLTSHRHDRAQSIDGHAPGPEQLMSHAPPPQLMLWHAAAPEQSMVQPRASVQSMSPQLALLHLNVQSKPAGHLTSPQAWLVLHSTRQVRSRRSQSVHGLGQPLDDVTQ